MINKLKIRDFEVDIPIIQGGMGVQISDVSLVTAVMNQGAIGTLSAIGLGDYKELKKDYVNKEGQALREAIKQIRKNTTKGILAVNILHVTTNYKNLVQISIEEGADIIVSGAGLPLDMPAYLNGNNRVALIPIVSSVRAAKIIYKTWVKKYDRIPDAFIIEGPKAGGHIGYKMEELIEDKIDFDKMVKDLIDYTNDLKEKEGITIPVIPAGGIFDGKDIAKYLKMGASGVQMATRFVCTEECDAHINFKNAFINAKKEDIVLINSPVGMPGRAIKNSFINSVEIGNEIPFKCPFRCLKYCNPTKSPYCIAESLWLAKNGETDKGLIFAGYNAYKVDKIYTVKDLIDELMIETEKELGK